MSIPSEKLIHKLVEKYSPGWETITSARSALVASFESPDSLLAAIEEVLDEKPTSSINKRPKPAIPLAFVANHIEDGTPPSYGSYQLCRTKCGKHFIGTCRGGLWTMKTALGNVEDEPIPNDMEVEYWVDLE